jgi:DNA repair exonuclease SbcCD ATPase subunit
LPQREEVLPAPITPASPSERDNSLKTSVDIPIENSEKILQEISREFLEIAPEESQESESSDEIPPSDEAPKEKPEKEIPEESTELKLLAEIADAGEKLEDMTAKYEASRKELEVLRAEISTLKQEISKKDREKQNLESEKIDKEKRENSKEISSLREELAMARKEIEKLTAEKEISQKNFERARNELIEKEKSKEAVKENSEKEVLSPKLRANTLKSPALPSSVPRTRLESSGKDRKFEEMKEKLKKLNESIILGIWKLYRKVPASYGNAADAIGLGKRVRDINKSIETFLNDMDVLEAMASKKHTNTQNIHDPITYLFLTFFFGIVGYRLSFESSNYIATTAGSCRKFRSSSSDGGRKIPAVENDCDLGDQKESRTIVVHHENDRRC